MQLRYLNFWMITGFRFLSRSVRSTAVLSLMVVIAVAALIFLASLAVGVNDAMIRNSTGLYPGQIAGEFLPQTLDPESLKIKGVAAVLKRSLISGTLSKGKHTETVTMTAVDPAAEANYTAVPKKVVSGRYLQNGERSIFLSAALAGQLDVRAGDVLQFDPAAAGRPAALTVAGIYRTQIEALDRAIAFCPAGILPVKTAAWQAAVFLKEGVDPKRIIESYRRLRPQPLAFKAWQERMPDLLQLIDLNYFSMAIVMVLVFGVVSVGIACAFVIFIFKNLREYGIMKAMGATPREIAGLLAGEVIMMNLVAAGAGLLAGFTAVWIAGRIGIDLTRLTSHNRYFAVSGIIYPRPTLWSLLLPPALALFFSAAAAVWPAALISRKKAADILRSI